MTKRIFKYTFLHNEVKATFELPIGARILHADFQLSKFHIWAEVIVDPGLPTESRSFTVYGTGQALPNNPGTFINTFMTHNDEFVWHIYEDPK